MCALAELAIIVAGIGDPHVEHGDRVIVIAQPAVAGDGVVSGLSGVQESIPLLVLQIHSDTDSSECTLQILTDSLVAFTGVVEVCQAREVLDLLGRLVELIVFLENFDCCSKVALQSILRDIIVASKAIIVNAGDGAHEHPTQALLDMLTVEEKLGTLEGKNVTIVGDIRHSRVARSNLWGMTTMGAHVTLCGPSTLVPRNTELMSNVTWESDVKKAVKNADAIIALRLQKERMDDALLPSMREYRNTFGITHELLECAKDKVLIMHPGPINRGVELDSEIADGDNSVILNQVTNGVAVRMAVLYLLAGGRGNE